MKSQFPGANMKEEEKTKKTFSEFGTIEVQKLKEGLDVYAWGHPSSCGGCWCGAGYGYCSTCSPPGSYCIS